MNRYCPSYDFLGLVATHRRKIRSGQEYDHLFPQPIGENVMLSGSASVFDTLDNILDIVSKTLNDTKKIASKLQRSNKKDTLKAIFDFAYSHIQYAKDKEGVEQLRRPARSWADRKTGIDCDCFSVFVGSILTNLKIPFYFRIIKRNYSSDYSHIYIVVPKNKNFNLNIRDDYYVIDPVLDKFDKEADSITQKFDKMGGIALEYLNGFSGNHSFAGSMGTRFGTEFNGLSGAMGEAQAVSMMIRGIKQNLINSQRMIDKTPSNGLYNKENLKKALNYAIANWDDPVKRDKALDVLARQDDKIMNVKAINGFCGLDGLNDGLAEMVFGGNTLVVGPDGQLIGLEGGLFTKVKEAVKNAGKKVVEVAKKAGTTVAKVAQKVGKAILKFNPLSVSIRAGMLLAAELNFAGLSKKLMWGYVTKEQAKAKGISEDTWQRSKNALASVEKLFVKALKGDAKNLQKAILGGKRKAAVGLGNPAALAPAMAFIVKVVDIIGKAFKGAKNIKEVVDTGKDLVQSAKEAKDLVDFSNKNPNAADEFDENADYVDDTTPSQVTQAPKGMNPAVYNPASITNTQVSPDPGIPSGNDTVLPGAGNNTQPEQKGGGGGGMMIAAVAGLGLLLLLGGKKGKGMNGPEDEPERKVENLAGVKKHKRSRHKKKVVCPV